MPTGSLKGAGKALWEKVYDASKKAGDDQETAARKAWAAVKSAGWHKNKDGEWVKSKSELSEFSLAIKKASVDPKTGERRWRADTSDIGEDSHGDSMSLELFSDFVRRIESNEQPPEEYRSEFWQGGEPYLSISHYPDLNGDAAPGISEKTYVDGAFLKARGRIFNNKLGDAAWNTIKYELEHKSEVRDPVRISIAFLDYEHQHKSTGTVYTRTENAPFCMECLLAEVNQRPNPKIYRKGHLIHYAMTRVPVNKRTIMEADMTTRMEDAESIIGKSLAEELEEKAALVGKAELVIKSENDEQAPAPEKEATEQVTVPAIKVDNPPELTEVVAGLTEQVKELSLLVKSLVERKMDKEPDPKDKDEAAEGEEECKGEGCGDKKKMPMKSEVVEVVDTQVAMVQMLSEAFAGAMAPLTQKMDILIAAQTQRTTPANAAPARRSLNPADVQPILRAETTQPGAPMSISTYARKSVGIE
jgi:hypothetical protein